MEERKTIFEEESKEAKESFIQAYEALIKIVPETCYDENIWMKGIYAAWQAAHKKARSSSGVIYEDESHIVASAVYARVHGLSPDDCISYCCGAVPWLAYAVIYHGFDLIEQGSDCIRLFSERANTGGADESFKLFGPELKL